MYRQDPGGYGLLYVDASQKANLGSSCSHSCNSNCTSAVVARNGRLVIVLTTVSWLSSKRPWVVFSKEIPFCICSDYGDCSMSLYAAWCSFSHFLSFLYFFVSWFPYLPIWVKYSCYSSFSFNEQSRHIMPGEELTMDYYSITTSDVEWRAAICLCGQNACRGSFLHYATQDDLQQVLNSNCGPLWRSGHFFQLFNLSMRCYLALLRLSYHDTIWNSTRKSLI